jgi:anti-anti-sigma factor
VEARHRDYWGKPGRRSRPRLADFSDPDAPFFAGLNLDAGDGTGRGTVTLEGELNLATWAIAAQALRRAERLADLVVLDLRGVSSMDSAGLHLLLDTNLRQRAAGRRLVVVTGSPHVRRVLDLTGVSGQLEITDDTAIEAMHNPIDAR